MGNKLSIIRYIVPILIFSNCTSNLDFSGYIRSTDRVNNRFEQSEEWNKLHPFKTIAVSADNYQLLVAADNHIGPTNNLKKLVELTNNPENTALVLVGDIVTGKQEDYLVLKDLLANVTKIPHFSLVGNHDLYFDGWKNFYAYFGSSVYYFSVETPVAKDLFICLDSGGGTLGDKQLAWLKSVLENQRTIFRHCVVFSHVNFFRNRHTGSTNPLVPEIQTLLDLFSKHSVNMVISGHDHFRATQVFGKTTFVTLDAALDAMHNASFLKLAVKNGTVTYDFQKFSFLN